MRQIVVKEGPAVYPPGIRRPKVRGDCEVCQTCQEWRDAGADESAILSCGHTTEEAVAHTRPCLFAACRMNLFLEVSKFGGIKYNFPGLEPGDMKESCALDVADQGGLSAAEVGDLMCVSTERVRQVQDGVEAAGRKVRRTSKFGKDGELALLDEFRPEGKPVFRKIDPEIEEEFAEEDEEVALEEGDSDE